jgi:hypothetical protein
MTVQEYRDLIDELNAKASALKSCVSDEERAAWIPYAERLRLHAWSVADACKRATATDRAKMDRARKALDAAFDSVSHLIPSPL